MPTWMLIVLTTGAIASFLAFIAVLRVLKSSPPPGTSSPAPPEALLTRIATLEVDLAQLRRLLSDLEQTVELRHKSVMTRIQRAGGRSREAEEAEAQIEAWNQLQAMQPAAEETPAPAAPGGERRPVVRKLG